jgi:hypothetical protein
VARELETGPWRARLAALGLEWTVQHTEGEERERHEIIA